MSKIDEIIQSGRAPGFRGAPAVDPDSVYAKAPKALRELESTPKWKHGPPHGAKGISKHFGMDVGFIKKTWGMSCLAFLLCLSAHAGDITRGYTFTTTASAADLHQLVDNAVINTTFFSSKPLSSAGTLADTLLILQNGNFFREPVSTMLGPIISGQAVSVPAGSDSILFYSVSGQQLYQTTFSAFLSNNFVSGFMVNTNYATIQPTNFIATYQGGTIQGGTNLQGGSNVWESTLQVFQEGLSYSTPTNLASETVLGTNDLFLVWATSNLGTNYQAETISKSNLLQTASDLSTTNITLPYLYTGGGVVFNSAHGLATTPHHVRAVLVNVTAEHSYNPGDEVDIQAFWKSSGGIESPAFVEGANTTNVFLIGNGVSANLQYIDKSGNLQTLTTNDWKGKIYYHP